MTIGSERDLLACRAPPSIGLDFNDAIRSSKSLPPAVSCGAIILTGKLPFHSSTRTVQDGFPQWTFLCVCSHPHPEHRMGLESMGGCATRHRFDNCQCSGDQLRRPPSDQLQRAGVRHCRLSHGQLRLSTRATGARTKTMTLQQMKRLRAALQERKMSGALILQSLRVHKLPYVHGKDGSTQVKYKQCTTDLIHLRRE